MNILSRIFASPRRIMGLKGSNGIGKRAKDNASGLASFYYSYNASIGADSYSYDIREEDGSLIFTFEGMQYREFGDMKTECDRSVLSSLYELYKEYRAAEWDGYDKSATKVLDGDGFSLRMVFRDGSKFSAHGSNAFPERYWDFKGDMNELLMPLRDKVLKENRQKLISKGIGGKLDSVMVHFKQQGLSGRNEYDFFIIDEKYREKNCEIRYKSVNEEYIPKGAGSYYVHIPLSEIGLDEIQKMINDYEILTWYGFEESASDYNNCEWFQVSFGFDDDLMINANGTEHPQHYDEFRNEFLIWFAKVVKKYCLNREHEDV